MPRETITLTTRQLTVRSTAESDLDELIRLWNDGAVMRWVGFPDGLGCDREKAERWLTGIGSSPDRYHFVARTREGLFCGEVYAALDRHGRRASLDIKFTPALQGGRRSREALGALIGWVFDSFEGIGAVWTEPNEGNLAAYALYFSCGLRPRERPAELGEGPSYWELTRADFAAMNAPREGT